MPSAASTSAFLDNLYQEKFGRAPDAAGKAYWSEQLASGAIDAASVTASFDASQEAQDRAAAGVAEGVADTASFEAAKAANEASEPITTTSNNDNYNAAEAYDTALNNNIAANNVTISESSGSSSNSSPAPAASTPPPPPPTRSDLEGQVESLYGDVLKRESDEEGLKYWTDQLESGNQTIDQIRDNISASSEAGETEDNIAWLNEQYQAGLDRDLGAEGQSYWLKDLAQGASRDDVATSIRNSAEFDTQADAFLQSQYQNLLDRDLGTEEGDDEGLEYWKNYLKSGTDRATISNQIANTDEGWLNATYNDLLNRPLGDVGRKYWQDDLAEGATREEVEANIKRSAEYACAQKGAGFSWDGSNCNAETQDCPDGQQRDASGNCVAIPNDCPAGQVKNSSGACVPEEITCPAGQSKDASGNCVPDAVDCPDGQTKDANGNCINTPIVCGTGEQLNAAGTGCVPSNPDPIVCPTGQKPNAAGTGCVPDDDGGGDNGGGETGGEETDPSGSGPGGTGTWMGPGDDSKAIDDPSGAYSAENPTQSYDNKRAEYQQLYAHTLKDKADLEGKNYQQLQRELQSYIDAQRDDETSRLRSGITIGGNQASQRPGNLKSGSPTYGSQSNSAGAITSGPKYKDDRPYAPRGVRKGSPISSSYFAMAERF